MCGLVLWSENALVNHSKACTGERAETEGKRRCEKCRKEFSKNNIARHRRTCTAGKRDGGVRGDVRQQERPPEETSAGVYRPKWAHCPQCPVPTLPSSSRQRTWRGTGPHVVGEGETDGGAFLGRGERPRRRRPFGLFYSAGRH